VDRRDPGQGKQRLNTDTLPGAEHLTGDLLDAFMRLARGDLTVRVARNYQRDTADTLAYFVNLIAEEMGRLFNASETNRQRLESGVAELNELFLRVAAGDFTARTQKSCTGDPLDVLGFLFDNTVQEIGQAFAEVERQRATLEAIFESMTDAVFLLDAGGRIERVNGSASRLLGFPVSELEGMSFSQLLSQRDPDAATGPGALMARQGDASMLTATGETIYLVLSAAPLVGEVADVRGMVVTARDERELRKAQAQLQLSDRMATMGTLAAGVAHEINNPLSFVISNLEFALEELGGLQPGAPLSAELREELLQALGATKEGADRVAGIVRELKSMSRTDEDTTSEIDVRRVLDTAASMLKNQIRHRARLVKDYQDVPPVLANEARLVQVALNLVQNAVQAIPVGAAASNQVRLATGVDSEGHVVISISDTGSGIPERDLEAIFEAFYTTKPLGVGTGLGLSICQRLIAQMGGRVEVDSAVGVGSTFRVYIPAKEMSLAAVAAAATSEASAPARRRVLVVDDEREIGESVQRLLRAEHDVDIAINGPEALDCFARSRYDVVFLDLMMPQMSGRDVLRELEARFPEHGAIVVLMSGGSFDREGETSEQRYVEKPFSPGELRRLIRELDDR